jgi:hypothetical protein
METPSLAELHARRQAIAERQVSAVGRVTGLVERHRALGSELAAGLASLQACVAGPEESGGPLERLLRPFSGRRRRSAGEALRARYEAVAVRLREAIAFTDELHLAALELQADVEALHTAQREVDALRAGLVAAIAEADAGATADDPLAREQASFRARRDRAALARLEVAESLHREHLGPARALRDTAWSLHEQLAAYLASASRVVDRAGGRVAVVGLLADAPAVVADLHASIGDLQAALAAAERYVADTRHLLSDVLPELTARLTRTEDALRAQADAEVEAALGGR